MPASQSVCGDSRGLVTDRHAPGDDIPRRRRIPAQIRRAMVQHHPFDDVRAESGNFRIVNGNSRIPLGRRHACHYDLALEVPFILLVLELFDGALAARAHRTQSGVPAEVRQVESQGETRMQKVLLRVGFVRLTVDVNGSHQARPITFGSYTVARGCGVRNLPGNTSARSERLAAPRR